MALQNRGTKMSLSDIVGEFGGEAPHALSEYKRSGIYVPNATPNNNIPTTNSQIRFDGFYGAVRGIYMTYEIIGAGGSGGAGRSGGAGAAGGSSTLTFNDAGAGSNVTVTSAGGAGGAATYNTGMSKGESSYYGAGGNGGADSDSNNDTAGYAAPSSSYGAGGGGGGANSFSARNGGLGGWSGGTDGASYLQYAWNSSTNITRYVGMPSTGTVLVVPSQTVTIVIGSGGAGGGGTNNGGRGANGFCKLTINGVNYTFTSTGTQTFTIPS